MTSLDFSLENLMAQLEQRPHPSDRQHRHLSENVVLNEEKAVIKQGDTVPTLPDSLGDEAQSPLEVSVNCRDCRGTVELKTDMLFTVPDAKTGQVSVLSVDSRLDLEPDPLTDAGWSGHWRERIQTRLQALEDWVWREEYALMRTANNRLPAARAQAREKLVRWFISMERGAVNLVIALGNSHTDLVKLQARLLAFDGVDSTLESSESYYEWQLVSTQSAAVKAVSRGASALNLYGLAVGEHLYAGC